MQQIIIDNNISDDNTDDMITPDNSLTLDDFDDVIRHNTSFELPHFSGAQNCAQCHDGITDSVGKDVSIVKAWQGTMMANVLLDDRTGRIEVTLFSTRACLK